VLKSRCWCQLQRSSRCPGFSFTLGPHFGTDFFDKPRDVFLGVAIRIAGCTIRGCLFQSPAVSIVLVRTEGLAEKFAHGAAFAFCDGFGLFCHVGGQADGVFSLRDGHDFDITV
jgi:hypothetical protein